jgi:hypothetical protein
MRLVTTLLLALVLVFAACAPRSAIPEAIPAAGLDWRHLEPQALLAWLRAERQRFTGLTAAFTLTMDDPPPGQFAYLTGLILIGNTQAGPPSLRIKALGPMGNVYFDMVLAGDDLGIYVPMRQTLYRGKASAMDRTGLGRLFSWLLFDPATARIPPGAELKMTAATVEVPIEAGRLTLDKRTGLPLAVTGQDMRVRFDRYQPQPNGFPPVPLRIEVADGEHKGKAVCTLSQVTPGPPPADGFDLSGYASAKVEPLEGLTRRR